MSPVDFVLHKNERPCVFVGFIVGGTCKIQNRNMAETLRCSIFEHFAVVRKNAQRYRIDSPVGDPQCSL
ncbi:MAG: hypothetical protein L6Q63_12130, partial [Giesbergeria sp.]|nr:hypothetical protein [Giesbergeria sp.]